MQKPSNVCQKKTDGRRERQREGGRNEEGRKLRKLKINPSVPLTLTQTHTHMHTHQMDVTRGQTTSRYDRPRTSPEPWRVPLWRV